VFGNYQLDDPYWVHFQTTNTQMMPNIKIALYLSIYIGPPNSQDKQRRCWFY